VGRQCLVSIETNDNDYPYIKTFMALPPTRPAAPAPVPAAPAAAPAGAEPMAAAGDDLPF
jgi:hypothetical protein